MADNGLKGRVKGILGGTPTLNGTGEQTGERSDPTVQQQALHVLDLAQRTAEECVTGAQRESDQICAAARAKAEQIVRDAQAHIKTRQLEAEKMLTDAQGKAEQIAREAKAYADKTRREADGVLAEARTQANEIARNAQANAEDRQREAKQRYDDAVGNLALRREALQSQIEALEALEREYRDRLTAFMQHQLRALWVDEPRVDTGEIE